MCVFDILEKIIVVHVGYCSLLVLLFVRFSVKIVRKNLVKSLCSAYTGGAARPQLGGGKRGRQPPKQRFRPPKSKPTQKFWPPQNEILPPDNSVLVAALWSSHAPILFCGLYFIVSEHYITYIVLAASAFFLDLLLVFVLLLCVLVVVE